MTGSSAPNVLWTDQGSGGSTGQYLEVLFSGPVTGVSALFGTSLGADITLEVFDGTTLLNSVTMVGGGSTGVLFGTIGLGNAGITSARFFSHSGDRSFNFSIDNLTFGEVTTRVPEPASAALVLLALAGLGASGRRKQA
jgi:hypothetical protein